MESPVLTLVIALFFAFTVESQQIVDLQPRKPPESSSPPLPPPPPPSLVSPRQSSTPPPPWPLPPGSSTPPPRLSHPSPPPIQSHRPPPRPSPSYRHPPPPPMIPPAAPALSEGGNHKLHKNLSPPPENEKTNTGKKIGLMFVGVASFLQVFIVAFLLISRRQLIKTRNGYERN